MEEQKNTIESNEAANLQAGDIRAGRKIGFYGCAFLILAVVIIVIVVVLTGIYYPFPGNEGVGP